MVFQQYQDPTVSKYLNYGYWWQAHREKIIRAARAFLIGLAAVFWLVTAYFVYGLLTTPGFGEILTAMAQTRAPVGELHQKSAPSPVRVLETQVIKSGEQRVDFLAAVENPNPNWSVEVEYAFVWAGGESMSSAAALLPGEKTVLLTAGVTVAAAPETASVRVAPIDWQRLRDRQTAARLNQIVAALTINNQRFVQEDAAAVAYEATNNSIYDLRDVRFIVVLSRFGKALAAGVNEQEILSAGQTVNLELRWPAALPAGASIIVYPRLPLLSPGAARSGKGGGVMQF